MQKDWPRVFTIFRQYSINSLFRMGFDLKQSLVGETPQVKREARIRFFTMGISMMMHAGFRGTIGYGLLTMFAAMLTPIDDDDEIERWLESWYADREPGTYDPVELLRNITVGMVLNGIPGTLTQWDMSERVGMPNLWMRDNDQTLDNEAMWQSTLIELLGPVAGITMGFARAGDLYGEGEWQRGTEAWVPKAARDGLRAMRYGLSGFETKNGDEIAEVGVHAMISQAMGFTPSYVAEAYDKMSRAYNLEARIEGERSRLLRAITSAMLEGQAPPAWTRDAIAEFNRAYPGYGITGDTVRRSLNARARRRAEMRGGMSINPRLRAYIEE
jgi:hypothetical protein